MRILVTGGAGYIGSHACVVFIEAGHAITVVDNLCNSRVESLRRVRELTGRMPDFHAVDLVDMTALNRFFRENGPYDAVVHFAGFKAVGESVAQPLRYYQNNLTGTLNLLEVMQAHGPKRLIFSSSATVYGDPDRVPITEDAPVRATNPYGRTKLMIETMLADLHAAEPEWQIAMLRYFNPVGAHPSGRIGEDPAGIPNNLLPYIAQVAVGKHPHLRVYGNDYPTPDGTGVRDYIHVMDLAEGHLNAVEKLTMPGLTALNLGTGRGYSVMQMLQAFEMACGRRLPYRVEARRPGDVAVCYADPSRAHQSLDWRAERGIDAMCADAWRWQSQNPDGYPPETAAAPANTE